MSGAMKTKTKIQQRDASKDLFQLVSMNMGEEEFGIDILRVREIIRMVEITRVPNAPHFVEGVINLRGMIIPVVDLRKKFGLKDIQSDKPPRIVVVEIGDTTVGMIVDTVNQVLRIPRDIIEPPPPIIGGIESEYILGVGKLKDRLLILLDIEKILSHGEKRALEGI
jgi:purine-binding chemotaxis protein CheW